ncbi:glycosyltransferase family 4 protein [Paraburkholderia sediminicola]|uniref:glycosyltransferase family 4 protein n=1 Tax=Paraburkholderia sediminicola TaxID=458836 RepID=UPI0038B96261
MKHVAFFSRAIPLHGIGGMERVTWDLACAFVRRGVMVTVVTSAVEGQPAYFESDGVRVTAIHGTTHNRYSKAFWSGSLQAFDVLVKQGMEAAIGVSAGARAIALHRPNRHVPVLMQAHGSSIGEFISKWRKPTAKSMLGSLRNLLWISKDNHVLSRYDAIVSISAAVKEQIERSAFLAKKHAPIEVVANGIDDRVFHISRAAREEVRHRMGFDSTSKVIVSVSRLHRQKGTEELLTAFERMIRFNPCLRLVIVGDGPDRAALDAFVSRRRLAAQVTFTGALTRDGVAHVLSAADTFCFLTRRVEGNPLNMMEALASGLPLVVSHGALNSIPSVEGLFGVDPTDTTQVKSALDAALKFAADGKRTELPDSLHLDTCVSEYLRIVEGMTRR